MPDYAEAERQYEIAETQADIADARAGQHAHATSEARRFAGMAKDCANADPRDVDGEAQNIAASQNWKAAADEHDLAVRTALDAAKAANAAAKAALED